MSGTTKCVAIIVEYIRVLLKGQTGHLSVTATANRYSHKHTENLPKKPSVSVPVAVIKYCHYKQCLIVHTEIYNFMMEQVH